MAAGATVVGLGVLGSPAQAHPATPASTGADEARVQPAPWPAGPSTAAPETYEDTTDDYGRHAAPAGSYTVVRGDTVSRIAAAFDQPWRELYHRNVGVIGPDPDLVLPGQVLAVTGAVAEVPAVGTSAGDPAPLAEPGPAPEAVPEQGTPE